MVEFRMDFFDVLFPLNIGPLTYRWSSAGERLAPGMLVRAEVKTSLQYGIVLRKSPQQPDGPIKEVAEALSDIPVVNETFLKLLKWMADYYLAPEGAVLKSAALVEFCRPAKARKKRVSGQESPSASVDLPLPTVSQDVVSPVRRSLEKRGYRTFLLHAPSIAYEVSSLLRVMEGRRGVVVLVPETTHIELLAPALTEAYGDRLAVLHGKLSKGQRRDVITRILSGKSDIVLGTRVAVTAPLPSVSLIAVLQEQNQAYKNLEGVRYHARDVAVMRGYLDQCTVVLSSTAPSVESVYNTGKAKYVLLSAHEAVRRPRMDVIDMRTAGKATPHLSRKALQAASSALKGSEKVLFLLNRKGYSLIQCAECSTVITCPACKIPLIYHKDRMALKCHYCSHIAVAPDTCGKCGSTRLETVGAGTQRIAADIKRHLGIEPLRIDRDALRDQSLQGLPYVTRGDEVIVGTKAVRGHLDARENNRLCVFLNPDISLNVPDFRSAELLFQEIIGIAEYVKPDGLILIQTKMPENHVFGCVRGYRFREFYAEELSMRRALAYPPYSRVIVMTLSSKLDMSARLADAFLCKDDKIECIGPVPLPGKAVHRWKVILKSALKERVSGFARNVLEVLKEEKGLRIAVDVDPIAL
jgi:primosomal protein N' (replication factor Y)